MNLLKKIIFHRFFNSVVKALGNIELHTYSCRRRLAQYTHFVRDVHVEGHCSVLLLRGVRLSSLGTAATTGLLYQSQMRDNSDCAAIGGINIGRGNRSTRRKPAPAPLCPPQTPHNLPRARNRASD
jgi:hypothetical protein